jgi:hypothetical protein
MTCRGYDPKAVKVPKSVKRIAATVLDNNQRSSLIKSYVTAIESNIRSSMSRKRDKD